ncbi:MAG: YbaB/EbfC family nucleoid-associated protein [Candidatus Pacebacteria bacterium]|jgi:DNA-binding protein YbaB|nr:YbaB/EbfC family nucleoid-associated protein [Candidatus Paceibacterota bacterium]MDD4074199.1 YbaB/EbfC family nucleoid-associated protein [Candidatus Paceibacterota bacterium]
MFDKLKDLKRLKDLDSSLSKEVIEKERNGIKVIINGKSEIISISLNPNLNKEEQEKDLKSCINDASNEAKMLMAKKASQITGFGL